MQNSRPRSLRSYLQFGLKSLMLATVVCAVAVTWWRQRDLIQELQEAHNTIQQREAEREFNGNLTRAFGAIDLDKSRHRELFYALRNFSRGFSPFASFHAAHVHPEDGGAPLEVLLFHFDTDSSHGYVATVGILLRNDEIMDFVARNESSRYASHGATLEDADNDGEVELLIDCEPGWSSVGSQPFVVAYAITPKGFWKMYQPPRQFRPFRPRELP
jgi:hypothetical protein